MDQFLQTDAKAFNQDALAPRPEFCYEVRMTRMEIDIEALIPHRGRMRLIDGVIDVDDERAVTTATASADWPLYRDGSVDVLVTIELVAQSAALFEGWKRKQSGKGGAKGWLVGIKGAEFQRPRIAVPAVLITEVRRNYAFESYAVFDGTVRAGAELVAALSIQAFRPEEEDA